MKEKSSDNSPKLYRNFAETTTKVDLDRDVEDIEFQEVKPVKDVIFRAVKGTKLMLTDVTIRSVEAVLPFVPVVSILTGVIIGAYFLALLLKAVLIAVKAFLVVAVSHFLFWVIVFLTISVPMFVSLRRLSRRQGGQFFDDEKRCQDGQGSGQSNHFHFYGNNSFNNSFNNWKNENKN
jgi:hypothetical protein